MTALLEHFQCGIRVRHRRLRESCRETWTSKISRPEICIGTDDLHTPDHLTNTIAKAFAGFGTVGVNEPFIGTYVPLQQYGTDQRVHSVMIEIRRDLYMDEATGESKDDVIEVLGERVAVQG